MFYFTGIKNKGHVLSSVRLGFTFRAIISQGNEFLFQDSNPKPAQMNSLRAEPVTIHPLRSFSYKLRLSRDSPSNFKFLCDQSVQRFFNSFKKYLMFNKKRFWLIHQESFLGSERVNFNYALHYFYCCSRVGLIRLILLLLRGSTPKQSKQF